MGSASRQSENSAVFGVVTNTPARQTIAFARVVSDEATFAYLADVFVREGERGRGIGKRLVTFAMSQPEYAGVRRWLLATKDAHDVYASLGWKPLSAPERFMEKFAPYMPAIR